MSIQIVTAIAAIGDNNVIGYKNKLLWHLPNDFKRFKDLTMGHSIIMGRKTYESLPNTLKGRQKIVLTKNTNYHPHSDINIVHSIDKALKINHQDPTPYIIGGEEIYTLAMPYTNKLELTRVHASLQGDAFFPKIDFSDWNLVQTTFCKKDHKHQYSFTYETYLKKH